MRLIINYIIAMCCLMQEILLLIITVVLCLLCWYYWSHRRILTEAWKLPAYFPNVRQIFTKDKTNIAFRLTKALLCNTTSAMVLWLGPIPIFMIKNPEDIQVVSNNALAVGSESDVVKCFVGNGLITAPVNIWRVTRKYITPQFHPLNLELLMPALNQSGRDLSLGLSKHAGMGPADLTEDIYTVVLKNTYMLIFGPDEDTNLNSKSSLEFCDSADRIRVLIMTRLERFWLRSELLFKFLYRRELENIQKSIENILPEILKVGNISIGKREEVKSEYNKGNGRNAIINEIRGQHKYVTLPNIFEALIQDDPRFSHEDLRNEIVSMLLAGSETSQTTMVFCLLALAAHPNIQERLHAEVVSVVGSDERDVTIEDIKAMPYLDQVVKETLRMFLTIPVITRVAERDLNLSFGTVPAGATILLVLPAIHLYSQYYPDPEKFDPDRFTPENVAKRQKYTFIPFLSGPRNCIGQTYGLMTVKTILVHLIRKYKFSTNVDLNKIDYLPGLVFRPKDVYRIEVQHRQ